MGRRSIFICRQYVRSDAAKPSPVGSVTASEPQISAAPPYRAFLSSGLLVFASSMVLSACGFLFHMIASRRLGVENYGAFYALVSLSMVAAVPVSLFSAVITKYAAEFRALHDVGHMRGLVSLIVRVFGLLGALYIAASVLFERSIGGFLHVMPWEIPLVGLMVAVFIVASALRAVATGIQSFGAYSASLCGEGLGKVALLLVFGLAGLTIGTSFAAFLLGMALGLVVMAIPLALRYRGIRKLPIQLDYRRILATTGGAASLTLTMAVMGFADVVLVKHFFNATSAGLYSAASLSGKIMLYFVGFIPTVLIPQATHRFSRGERTRETLWAAILVIVVVSTCGVAAYHFGGILLLHVLMGRAFDAAAPFLPGYAAAMALLALTNALASYGIATHRLGFALPLLLATLAALGLITAAHASLQMVIADLIAGNALMAFVVAVALGWQGRRAWAS
jgi:O-antigen/teichoic acid export membrane protein